MADRMAGEILIGGAVPGCLLPELREALSAQFVSLNWGDARFVPESDDDLLDYCVDQRGTTVLRLCHDEAPDGAFETLESFLRTHLIPFDRYSDGRYEYDPEWACFRPETGLRVFTTNSSFERLYSERALTEVKGQLEMALGQLMAGKLKAAIARLRRTQRRLTQELSSGCEPLPPFELVGRPHPSKPAE